MYYDMNGNPITMEAFAKMYEADERSLGDDDVINEKDGEIYRVSTVLLGMDHGVDSEGRPLIFETMIFSESGQDLYMERYATRKEAEEGHTRILEVAKTSAIVDPWDEDTTRPVECPGCDGTGVGSYSPRWQSEICRTCGGTGDPTVAPTKKTVAKRIWRLKIRFVGD